MDINYFHQKETKTEVVEIVPEDIYNHEADECDKENEIQLPEVQVKLERFPTNIPKLALHLPQPIVKLERIKIEPNESESIPEVLSKSQSENVGNSSRSEALSESQSENAGDSSKSKASSESQSKDVCDSNSDNQSESQLTTIPESISQGHKKSKLKSVRKSNPQKVKGITDGNNKDDCQTRKKPTRKKKGTTKFQCHDCGYETYDKSNLTKHMTQTHRKVNSLKCKFCEYRSYIKRDIDSHLYTKHYDNIKDEIDKFISHKIYKCDQCNYQTLNHGAFKGHRLSIHKLGKKEELKCLHCKYTTFIKQNFNTHMRNHSNTERKRFYCQYCSKKATTKSIIASHLLKHHRETLGDTLTTVLDLKVHLCDQCDYAAMRGRELKEHKTIKHGVEPEEMFKCEVCGYETHSKNRLRNHMVIHSGRKRYICLACHKRFMHKPTLYSHILKNHSDDAVLMASITTKYYNCTICPFQSFNLKALNQHMSSSAHGNYHFDTRQTPQSVSYDTNRGLRRETYSTNQGLGSETYSANQGLGSETYSVNQGLCSATSSTNQDLGCVPYCSTKQGLESETYTANRGLGSETYSVNQGLCSETYSVNQGLESGTSSTIQDLGCVPYYSTNQGLGSETYTANRGSGTETYSANRGLGTEPYSVNQGLCSETYSVNQGFASETSSTNQDLGCVPYYSTNQSLGSETYSATQGLGSDTYSTQHQDSHCDTYSIPILTQL